MIGGGGVAAFLYIERLYYNARGNLYFFTLEQIYIRLLQVENQPYFTFSVGFFFVKFYRGKNQFF